MTRVVIIATHPIQYHAPWYRELAKQDELEVTVLFGMQLDEKQQSQGFGTEFTWDIPLLDGYDWERLENQSANPGIGKFSGIDCPHIKDTLIRLKADVVILTGWQSKLLIQSLFAARSLKLAIIMRGESNAMYERVWYKRLLHRAMLSRIDAFLAIGSSNRLFYEKNAVSPEKIYSAPYFVENNRFQNSSKLSTEEMSNLRESLGIAKESFCFVYSGKLIDKKNVQEILSAFALFSTSNQNAHLLIIGDGVHKENLEQYAKTERLSVTFAGFINQTEIPKMYAIGDCFLLASNFGETWGLVVNEAMVCGLPAIVSDRVGCGPDLILEGITGFSYTFGQVEDLASKMREISMDRQISSQMGDAARHHVLENFDVKHTVAATKKAISDLADAGEI